MVEEGKTLDDGKNPVMLYRLGAHGATESPDSCHESPCFYRRLQKCRILARQVLLWRRFRRRASAEAAASLQRAYFSDSSKARTSASLGFAAMSPFSAMPPMVMMPISSQFRYAFMALYAAMAAS